MGIEAHLRLVEAPVQMAQVEILLPSQHFGPRRKQTPEERLMFAILQDAIDCLNKYRFTTNARYRRLFHEAKQWVLAEETDWPYSFECICDVLELDSNAVRQRLHVTPAQRSPVHTTAQGHRQRGISRPCESGTKDD